MTVKIPLLFYHALTKALMSKDHGKTNLQSAKL